MFGMRCAPFRQLIQLKLIESWPLNQEGGGGTLVARGGFKKYKKYKNKNVRKREGT